MLKSVLWVTFLFIITLPFEGSCFSAGSGTKDDPYHITTVAQLDSVRFYRTSHFILKSDIDLDRMNWIPIGDRDSCFSGSFDGNNHAINNMSVTGERCCGLFGRVEKAGIKDVILKGCWVKGKHLVGGLVGGADGAEISNVILEECWVKGGYVGGLVGSNDGSTIRRCHVQGVVIGSNTVGGLAGSCGIRRNKKGIIESSSFIGRVEVPTGGGGFVGSNAGVIKRCFSAATIEGERVAGFVNSNRGTITDCYAAGSCIGKSASAFVARNRRATSISNTYSLVHIESRKTYQDLVSNSFYCTELTPQYKTFLQAKPMEEMVQKKTYVEAGWDFENIWEIREGETFPGLRAVDDIPCVVACDRLIQKKRADTQSIAFDIENTVAKDADLEIKVLRLPKHATAKIEGNTLIYTPQDNWVGQDSLRVAVSWGEDFHCERELQYATFSGGKGTVHNPLQINTMGELNMIRHYPDKAYLLTNNIDCKSSINQWIPIGDSIRPFTGSFEGNGYVINNLFFFSPEMKDCGLFGYALDARISGVTLQNCVIEGKDRIGSLVGTCRGFKTGANIVDCHANGIITGSSVVGGLIGYCSKTTVQNSSFEGDVVAVSYAGGFCGYVDEAQITASHAKNEMNGKNHIGGFAGLTTWDAQIRDCFAITDMSNKPTSGLFIGKNSHYASVQNTYAIGSQGGPTKLIGDDSAYTKSNFFCHESGQMDAEKRSFSPSSMKKKDLYADAGWDFDSVWGIDSKRNGGYPYLLRTETRNLVSLSDTETFDAFSNRVDRAFFTVRSSSILQEKDTYSHSNLFDDDPNTAWVEGKPGVGKGEWVEIAFLEPTTVKNIIIVNGYTKSSDVYFANSRVKEITLHVTLSEGDSTRTIRLRDGSFHDQNGLRGEMLEGMEDVKTLRIIISEVYKGTQYDDTCISELVLLQ